MNHLLKPLTRALSVASAIALAAVIFLPLWRIDLTAPQYPEGLGLIIRPNGLDGNVDVVNGLNHYIGMRTLHTEDFVEFKVLPYIIGAFALFGLLTFIIRRRWFFTIWAVLYIAFGILAMVDFYRWEYNYGHNLDPTAPIQVPGMAYQPPLIGFKQLLNFGAYSYPDIGGWIFLTVGAIMVFGLYLEWKTSIKKLKFTPAATGILLLLFFSSCNTKPEPIHTGTDACYFCKMTISQPTFAAEWITSKGKLFKFDDIQCLTNYLNVKDENEQGVVWLVDHLNPSNFIVSTDAWLLKTDNLRSPMGGNVAAFSTETDAISLKQKMGGDISRWKDIQP
jgi:copper chaperone NosL